MKITSILEDETVPAVYKKALFMFQQKALTFYDCGEFDHEHQASIVIKNGLPTMNVTFPEHYGIAINIELISAMRKLLAKVMLVDEGQNFYFIIAPVAAGGVRVVADTGDIEKVFPSWDEAADFFFEQAKDIIDDTLAQDPTLSKR